MQRKSTVHRFIDEERASGKNDQEIRHDLLDAGWHMDIIQHAMGETEPSSDTAPPKQTAPSNSTKRLVLIGGAVLIALILLALFI